MNKLVEEAPYNPGYEDAGFQPKESKQLTNQEIKEEIQKMLCSVKSDEDFIVVSYDSLIEFARAILRKAQEK